MLKVIKEKIILVVLVEAKNDFKRKYQKSAFREVIDPELGGADIDSDFSIWYYRPIPMVGV